MFLLLIYRSTICVERQSNVPKKTKTKTKSKQLSFLYVELNNENTKVEGKLGPISS